MKSTYFVAALGSLFFSLLPTAMAGHCSPHPPPSGTVPPYPPSSTPSPPPELDNTGNFTILASNVSYPNINGKFVWINSGVTYLDRGVQNPRFSYPVGARLENNRLIRIPVPSDPGGASTLGYLNFGTSNVCCSYAPLGFTPPASIPVGSRVDPFFIDTRGALVFERPPFRQEWYVCGKTELPGSDPGEERRLWLGLPFYEYNGQPEKFCVLVTLGIVMPVD